MKKIKRKIENYFSTCFRTGHSRGHFSKLVLGSLCQTRSGNSFNLDGNENRKSDIKMIPVIYISFYYFDLSLVIFYNKCVGFIRGQFCSDQVVNGSFDFFMSWLVLD